MYHDIISSEMSMVFYVELLITQVNGCYVNFSLYIILQHCPL
jgi:hypothetical protein